VSFLCHFVNGDGTRLRFINALINRAFYDFVPAINVGPAILLRTIRHGATAKLPAFLVFRDVSR
jgi:hypothetical protein